MLYVWVAEVGQLEDAEVHALLRGIALLLLLRLLPLEVHALLRGIALLLLLQFLPSKVHTLLRGTTLPLLPRILPSEEETGGPVAYTMLFCPTCKCKESGEFVSQRAKEVVESHEQQLIEQHGDDSSQHPQFDASAWLVATDQPMKGRVFRFGTGMDAGGVISSIMESRCSAASYSYTQSPPPPQQPTELPDHYCSALII
ncbi:hypothetical protein Taro_020316 [Colocasia esculenta]|uniref:Uncharacterized protein n=1 Tax=Colocasia esculenta TaxID=4460 RepID=A0A843UW44_COLES|nr:hypothetical protein [Colocasia esculenta]